MSAFTHDLVITKRLPGDPPKQLGDSVVTWAALTDEDVKRFSMHPPAEIYNVLKEAIEERDWDILKGILEDMEYTA
jgi:hypothetical protein